MEEVGIIQICKVGLKTLGVFGWKSRRDVSLLNIKVHTDQLEMLTSLIFHIMLSFWISIKFEQQDCVRGRSAKPQSRMLFSFLRVHFRQFFNKKNCFSGVLVSHRQTIKHMLGVLTSPLNQNSKFAIIQFGQILLLIGSFINNFHHHQLFNGTGSFSPIWFPPPVNISSWKE